MAETWSIWFDLAISYFFLCVFRLLIWSNEDRQMFCQVVALRLFGLHGASGRYHGDGFIARFGITIIYTWAKMRWNLNKKKGLPAWCDPQFLFSFLPPTLGQSFAYGHSGCYINMYSMDEHKAQQVHVNRFCKVWISCHFLPRVFFMILYLPIWTSTRCMRRALFVTGKLSNCDCTEHQEKERCLEFSQTQPASRLSPTNEQIKRFRLEHKCCIFTVKLMSFANLTTPRVHQVHFANGLDMLNADAHNDIHSHHHCVFI